LRLIIEIDQESNTHKVTAENGDMPFVINGSVERMAQQIAILREVYNGTDVDSVFFCDSDYMDS
jgi:hypothetical protein